MNKLQDVSLAKFLPRIKAAVDEFEAYYREMNADPKESENFPIEMSPYEWHDQFLCWMEHTFDPESEV